MSEVSEDTAVITKRLNLATGFLANERGWVVERLAALGSRLRSYRDDQVDLEISVKDRSGVEQHVTLECWINRTPRLHLVATSSEADLPTALNEVRNELIRQVDEAKTRTEPRSNRALRSVPALSEHDQPRRSQD